MKLLFLGDSLLFGRASHNVFDQDTWPFILAKHFSSTPLVRGHSGSCVRDVINEAGLLRTYWYGHNSETTKPIIFVQVGTVDVAPRLLPRGLHFKAKFVPGYANLLRSPRAYKLIGRPWVNKNQFDSALKKLNSILMSFSEHVFYIEIPRPTNFLLTNVGDYSSRVTLYNNILATNSVRSHFVSWSTGNHFSDLMLPDGHHLNHSGHLHLATCAEKSINKAISTMIHAP